jgi:hypothetical protein
MGKKIIEKVDTLILEVLEMYPEDIFTPATDADRKFMNMLDPNMHTRLHCSGIRFGLHQLRRVARELSAGDDLEVLHVPKEKNALDKYLDAGGDPDCMIISKQWFKDQLKEARIKEIKKTWGHAREHTLTDIEMIMHQTGGKVDFIEAVDTKYLEKRLAALEEEKK